MLVSAVALGFVVGLIAGGDPRRLTRIRVRGLPILLGAGALRVLGFVTPLPVLAYVGALLLIVAVAILNRHIPGAWLAALGIALNLLVIALNGGMPVDLSAAHSVGVQVRDDGLHIPLSNATVLPLLADILPAAVFRNVYSLGDVLLAAGGFWIVFRLLRRRV